MVIKFNHRKFMWAADEKLIINELGPNFSRPRNSSSNTGAQATMVRCYFTEAGHNQKHCVGMDYSYSYDVFYARGSSCANFCPMFIALFRTRDTFSNQLLPTPPTNVKRLELTNL